MKKFYLMLAVVLLSLLSANAQINQVVWVNGRAVMGQAISQVDSIKYGTMEEADRLYLTLPRKVVIHDTIIKTTVVRDTIHIPADAIAGVFSVAADKKVCFAKGNLQYTQSTKTWSFAEHQYDMIGEANVSGDDLADKIDLFGWSGGTGTAKWGISTSTSSSDYRGDFVDWGTNIGDGKTWYTLAKDEWYYLCYTRANATKLKGVSRINLNADGTEYANGLVLLPDNWTCPTGVTFKSGSADDNSIQAYADYQTFSLSEWQKLEAAGAVFLPASAYYRYGVEVNNVQTTGGYWSATAKDLSYVYFQGFDSDGTYSVFVWRHYAKAVRLVADVK